MEKKEIEFWREDETYSEYKARKHTGMQGMGQKTVKNKDNWTPEQKRGLIKIKVEENKTLQERN